MSATYEHLPRSLHWYFQHPGAWDHIKQAILDHDPTCKSLPEVWTGRTGGVSCPSDLARCDDCEVSFYNEGLIGKYAPGWKFGDPILETDGREADLCECCGRKRRASDSGSSETP